MISASSAFRCRVSCTSRAFSSATLKLPGQRLEELLVGLAERVLPIEVLERDHAGRVGTDDERHEDCRLRCLTREHEGASVTLGFLGEPLVDQERLARLEHVLQEMPTSGM